MIQNLVSIIIPIYNDQVNIIDTIKSVKSQVHDEFECIIIDDGSTDSSREIIKQHIEEDERFTYIYQSNKGLSSARNKGLSLARGNYIQFLDSDDLISQTKIYDQISFFQKNRNADIVYCNYQYFNSENYYWNENKLKIQIGKSFLTDLILYWGTSFSIPIHCMLIKKNFLEMFYIKFDETLPAKEDLDFHLQCALRKVNIQFINSIDAFYRVSGNSMSQNMTRMTLGGIIINRKLFSTQLPLKIKLLFIIQLSNVFTTTFISLIKRKKINFKIILQDVILRINFTYCIVILSAIIISPLLVIQRLGYNLKVNK